MLRSIPIPFVQADGKYLKKLEETTKEDKRRRRHAEAKAEACERDIKQANERAKVGQDKTR